MPPCWILCYRRTGSTYLSELLNNTRRFPTFRHPKLKPRHRGKAFGEWLRYHKTVPTTWPRCLKAIDHQFFDLTKRTVDLAKLQVMLPDVTFLYLRRQDKVRHAASLYIAKQLHKWHIYSPQMLQTFIRSPVYIRERELLQAYHEICRMNRWDAFLGNNPRLEVVYEELMSRPVQELRKIYKFLGLRVMPHPRLTVQITNAALQRSAHPMTEQVVEALRKLL